MRGKAIMRWKQPETASTVRGSQHLPSVSDEWLVRTDANWTVVETTLPYTNLT